MGPDVAGQGIVEAVSALREVVYEGASLCGFIQAFGMGCVVGVLCVWLFCWSLLQRH